MSQFLNGYDLLPVDSAYPTHFGYDGRILTVRLSEDGAWKEEPKSREFEIKFEPRWFAVSDSSDKYPNPPFEDNPLSVLGLDSLSEWAERDGFRLLFYKFNHYDHPFRVICIENPVVTELAEAISDAQIV